MEESCASWDGKYPSIHKVLAPSQVVVWDFVHQQFTPNRLSLWPVWVYLGHRVSDQNSPFTSVKHQIITVTVDDGNDMFF